MIDQFHPSIDFRVAFAALDQGNFSILIECFSVVCECAVGVELCHYFVAPLFSRQVGHSMERAHFFVCAASLGRATSVRSQPQECFTVNFVAAVIFVPFLVSLYYYYILSSK